MTGPSQLILILIAHKDNLYQGRDSRATPCLGQGSQVRREPQPSSAESQTRHRIVKYLTEGPQMNTTHTPRTLSRTQSPSQPQPPVINCSHQNTFSDSCSCYHAKLPPLLLVKSSMDACAQHGLLGSQQLSAEPRGASICAGLSGPFSAHFSGNRPSSPLA